MIKDYDSLIKTSKTLAKNVIVITPPPRLDDVQAMIKLSSFNTQLKQLSHSKQCGLIEFDKHFELSNNTINESLLNEDGLHLSDAGTEVLIATLRNNCPAFLNEQHDVPLRPFIP
jgi:lysophospholipase L1-like esterase